MSHDRGSGGKAEGNLDPGARRLRPSVLGLRGAVTPGKVPLMMPSRRGLAAGLLLGAALDAVLADPRRGHPVAAFGAAASRAEAALWADSRGREIGRAHV